MQSKMSFHDPCSKEEPGFGPLGGRTVQKCAVRTKNTIYFQRNTRKSRAFTHSFSEKDVRIRNNAKRTQDRS